MIVTEKEAADEVVPAYARPEFKARVLNRWSELMAQYGSAHLALMVTVMDACLAEPGQPITKESLAAYEAKVYPPQFTENRYEFECGVCHRHFFGRKGRCICDGCKAPTT